MTNFVGIDYSITSPAMVILNDKATAYFYSKKPVRLDLENLSLISLEYPHWENAQERYHDLANGLVNNIPENSVGYIENYAFSRGSSGMIFNIAEATQTFKSLCYQNFNIIFDTIPPSTLKKYATGNGRAKKSDMAIAFEESTGHRLHEILNCKIDSVSSDIIDAWFIAQYCKEQHNDNCH